MQGWEAVQAFTEGKTIRRAGWERSYCLTWDKELSLRLSDLVAADWEITEYSLNFKEALLALITGHHIQSERYDTIYFIKDHTLFGIDKGLETCVDTISANDKWRIVLDANV